MRPSLQHRGGNITNDNDDNKCNDNIYKPNSSNGDNNNVMPSTRRWDLVNLTPSDRQIKSMLQEVCVYVCMYACIYVCMYVCR